MADDKKHLVPIFIIYADGARLDTEHEGAVRRIRVSDRLDGIGRCVIEFGHPAAALLERGAIVPESAVDVHLGYKDDCEKVFGGEVTGLEYGYSEYGGEYLRVTVSGRLHRLRNAVRSESYERKTAGGFVAEMLDRYGLKADIEDFGPEAEVSVHHLESDWDFLIEHAKRYGRSVYEQDGTVYVKNEITVSQDDIVLEFGKSIISFRVRESLEGQISKCTYTGWNMTKAEGITGSAEIGEVPVKVGGGTSWADEARIFPGIWESVIDSQGVKDAEDARNRALGELQNASMEWQKAEVRCEGDHRIRPGMRVTLKYVGERFSGEYVAERVEHEFGIDGFITEVHLRRNMLPGEITLKRNISEVDVERASIFNENINNKTLEENTTESSNQREESDAALETEDGNPKIIKVELLDDNNKSISGSEITNYVNLPDKDMFIDNDKIKGHYQLNGRIKCKVTFDKKGVFDFNVSLKSIELKACYSPSELTHNSNYKFSKENESKQYKTDSDGTKIISTKDFYFGQGGGNLFKFKAWTSNENNSILSSTGIRTWRRLYYVEVRMSTLTTMASSLAAAISEYKKHYIDLKKIGSEFVSFRENIDVSDSTSFTNDVLSQCNKPQYKKYFPYVVNITYTGHLAVKESKQFRTIIPLNSLSYIEYELRNLSDNSKKPLWINIDSENWFNSCTLKMNGTDYGISENKITPLETSPNFYLKVKIDISHLSIPLPATAELLLNVNIVNRMRAGISFGRSHTIALCTKAYWKDILEVNQNQVLIHELGHQVGMVPDGDSSKMSKLDKGIYHYTHTHVGDHCYNGCSSTEDLKSISALRNSVCVMFGATNNKSNFCTDCGKNVKKTDLSGGLY